MKKYLAFTLMTILVACGGTKTQEKETISAVEDSNTSHHIAAISKVFDAHGGYDTWSSLKQLSYESGNSKTMVDLQSRYTRIESENQTVGFDGEKVWVNPPNENADRQRMRYNLMFYFYAFPFVVGDPGINYEELEQKEIKGKAYNAVKISYDAGVGDSPKDNYIILSDPQTNKMEWLMYTATFGSEESSDRYNLIQYEGWQNYNGVVLPGKLQWYQFREGVVGDPRGNAREFSNIQVSTEHPAMENFTMPEGAQVAADPDSGS